MIDLTGYLAEASMRSAQMSGVFSAPCWALCDRRTIGGIVERGLAFVRSAAITVLIALAAMAAFTSDRASALLEASRPAVADGEFWRVLTGHITHWSVNHFAWDLFMFIVLGAALESRDRSRYLALLAASALAISAAVFCLQAEIVRYRGLSGVDSALFVAFSIQVFADARGNRKNSPQHSHWLAALAMLLLLSFLGKTVYDCASGDTLFVDSSAAGFTPLALAHVAGALTAICLAAIDTRPHRQLVSIA